MEVLANATTAIEVKNGKDFDFVYHPQTMALCEWFEMGATSNAIDGAFSYTVPVVSRDLVPEEEGCFPKKGVRRGGRPETADRPMILRTAVTRPTEPRFRGTSEVDGG